MIVSLQVIQAVFFGICVLTDLSSLLTRGSGNQEQERQLRKLISLRDWTLAVLAFPVGVVSMRQDVLSTEDMWVPLQIWFLFVVCLFVFMRALSRRVLPLAGIRDRAQDLVAHPRFLCLFSNAASTAEILSFGLDV